MDGGYRGVSESFVDSFDADYTKPHSSGWQSYQQNQNKTIEGKAVRKPATSPVSSFKTGERIFHQKFGYGHITSVSGNKLSVAFEKAGDKKVLDGFVERA